MLETSFRFFMSGGHTGAHKKGILVPIIAAIMIIILVAGFAVYNYSKHERGVVVRFRYVSVADKMAQAAAQEAFNWFKYGIITRKEIAPQGSTGEFILKPLKEKSVNGLIIYLTTRELKSFELIERLGGKLKSVDLKYEGFQPYFKEAVAPPNYYNGCLLSADPFERFGGLSITAKATYMGVTRVYGCRHEIKISNTLAPVISKFTVFSKNKDNASENQMVMATTDGETDIGGQGIIDMAASKKRVPVVFVHHPDDVKEVSGYSKSHAELREYLPVNRAVASTGDNYYRPSIAERGWVYLGCENPDEYYALNVPPGKANPDMIMPYKEDKKHLFYGTGFMMLESDLCWLVMNGLKGIFPYSHSFTDATRSDGINDYIIRTTHTGIYWIVKDPDVKPILGNYYLNHPEFSTNSSLLHLSGDLQPLAFGGVGKPSKYLDRRSPTVVFGKVFRSFVQIGNLTQNCIHSSSANANCLILPNGMHRLPYINPPNHPNTTFLPYFNIGEDGQNDNNPVMDIDDQSWGGYRFVDDGNIYGGGDFAPVKYDIDHNVFNLCDSNHLKTYRQSMTKIVNEVYNKSYNWIVANSKPLDGVLEPGDSYGLKQDEIKVLSSYPDAQLDSLFFYNHKKKFGNVFQAGCLKISQYVKNADAINISNIIFPDGFFKGALGAIKLYSDNYVNPVKSNSIVDPGEFDIRQKSNYNFDSYDAFLKNITSIEGDVCTFHDGGIYYIDFSGPVDMGKNGAIKKIVFNENTLLIFKDTVKIPSITKSSYASANNSTITIISVEGDIIIAASEIEASLNSFKGTIKKELDYFQVFGNITMNKLPFDPAAPNNLFKAENAPADQLALLGKTGVKSHKRVSVTYDPSLDPCGYQNYYDHYKYFISSYPAYWRYDNE